MIKIHVKKDSVITHEKNILIRSSIAYIHIWIWTDVVFTFYCYVHNYRYEYCIGIKIMISANLDRWSQINR